MTATIKPGVRFQIVDEDSDPEVIQIPDLKDVPVLFPNFGGSIVFFPLAPGAPGRLEFSEEDDSLFYRKSSALPVNPVVLERHGGWAVFRPEGSRAGAFLEGEPSSRGYIGEPGGAGVSFGDDLRLGGSDATDRVIRVSDLEAIFDAWTPVSQDGGAALKAVWSSVKAAIGSPKVKAK